MVTAAMVADTGRISIIELFMYFNYNYGFTSNVTQAKYWEVRDKMQACGWYFEPSYVEELRGEKVRIFKATRWYKGRWCMLHLLTTKTSLSFRKDLEKSIVFSTITQAPPQELFKGWIDQIRWLYLSIIEA